jgi:hypothetical protein
MQMGNILLLDFAENLRGSFSCISHIISGKVVLKTERLLPIHMRPRSNWSPTGMRRRTTRKSWSSLQQPRSLSTSWKSPDILELTCTRKPLWGEITLVRFYIVTIFLFLVMTRFFWPSSPTTIYKWSSATAWRSPRSTNGTTPKGREQAPSALPSTPRHPSSTTRAQPTQPGSTSGQRWCWWRRGTLPRCKRSRSATLWLFKSVPMPTASRTCRVDTGSPAAAQPVSEIGRHREGNHKFDCTDSVQSWYPTLSVAIQTWDMRLHYFALLLTFLYLTELIVRFILKFGQFHPRTTSRRRWRGAACRARWTTWRRCTPPSPPWLREICRFVSSLILELHLTRESTLTAN